MPTDHVGIRDRIRQLLQNFWMGDKVRMSDACGVAGSTLKRVLTKSPSAVELNAVLRGILKHDAISSVWLYSGTGHWRKTPGSTGVYVHVPRPKVPLRGHMSRKGTTIGDLVSQAISQSKLVEEIKEEIKAEEVEVMAANPDSPAQEMTGEPELTEEEELLMAELAEEAELLAARSEPEPPELVAMPEPVAPEPLTAPAAFPLDFLREVLNRLNTIEGAVAFCKGEQTAVLAKFEVDQKRYVESQVHFQEGVERRFAAMLRDQRKTLDDVKTDHESLRKEQVNLRSKASQSFVHETIQSQLRESFGTFTGQIATMQRQVESRLSRVDELERDREESVVDAVGEFGTDVAAMKERQETILQGQETLANSVELLLSNITAMTDRLDRVESGSHGGKRIRVERDLNGETKLTVSQWCGYKGKHKRLFASKGHHVQLGRALAGAYKRFSIPVEIPDDAPNARPVYPVADLRHFMKWYLTSMLNDDDGADEEGVVDISYEEWYHYFEQHALSEWKVRLEWSDVTTRVSARNS